MGKSKTTNPAALHQPRNIFDPWDSSTGHQVSNNPLSRSTGWRQTRTQKLAKQFRSGGVKGSPAPASAVPTSAAHGSGGGGGGSDGEWRWVSGEEARIQESGREDIRGFMAGERKRKLEVDGKNLGSRKTVGVDCEGTESRPAVYPPSSSRHVDGDIPPSSQAATAATGAGSSNTADDNRHHAQTPTPTPSSASTSIPTKAPNSKIFAGLTVYINGSTAPLISDHKLKHVLTSHGASIAIALGRRSVTHVILGTPSSQGGAGGGLAAGKIQKEIMKKRGGGGTGVRFVGVEWVLESLKANKRLPEAGFSNLPLAAKGQRSVTSMFEKKG